MSDEGQAPPLSTPPPPPPSPSGPAPAIDLPPAPPFGFPPSEPLPPPPVEPPPPSPFSGLKFAAIVGLLVVVAVSVAVPLALTRRGGPAASPPLPAPPSPSVGPPTALAASSLRPFVVTLAWFAPRGLQADSYSVYRNQTFVGSTTGTETLYEDATVTPGKKYTYEVKSVAGNVESGVASVRVTVPTPPLSQARVEGDFNVVVKATSVSGFSSYDSTYTLGWHFRPKCGSGPCAVVWADLAEKTLRTVLSRKGGSYSGSDSGHFNVKCNGTLTTSNLAIRVHVTRARGMDGAWRATRLVGTVTQDDPSALGCVSSHADLSVTASLLS